jgi:hypothetical protein
MGTFLTDTWVWDAFKKNKPVLISIPNWFFKGKLIKAQDFINTIKMLTSFMNCTAIRGISWKSN